MELFPLLILLSITLAEIFRDRPQPTKSEEEALGEAITKYLSKGIKVIIEAADDGKKS